MKLWSVKNSECVKSLEVSEDDSTVWALAVSTDEDYIITGASNSTLILWKVTFPACPSAQFCLPSSRHHMNYDDCPEDKMEKYQNCSVLCCV